MTLKEAADVLFALDEAVAALPDAAPEQVRLQRAAGLIVEKLMPDLPDL